MPAEWERHAATWLAWPHNAADWPGKFQPIPWVFCEIVRHLSRVEDVHILVQDEGAKEARSRTTDARAGASLERVHFHLWPTDRIWTRDSGPIFITKAPAAVTNTAGIESAERRIPLRIIQPWDHRLEVQRLGKV